MPIDYVVYQGGLMRCCLSTIAQAMEASSTPPQDGDVLKCRYHPQDEGMIFGEGAWRWNRKQQPWDQKHD
jgi:hypothetical protein